MKNQAAGGSSEASPTRKICIVSHDTPSIIPFRGHLLRSLVAKGYDVQVLAPNATRGDIDAIEKLKVRCESYSLDRTGLSPLTDLHMAHSLYRHFKTSEPDVAIFYAAKPCVFGPAAARASGVPWRIACTEGLGIAFTDSGKTESLKWSAMKSIVRLLYKASLPWADRVIFLNSDDQGDFIQLGLVTKEKARVVGGIGVDVSEYAHSQPPSSTLLFLFVGRLLREKGVYEFVQAAKLVRRRSPSARFVVLGALDNNPGGITKDLLNQWVQSGVIEYYGHGDVKPWLSAASVFVLPSYREGVPRSTQEAMAVGRAVVTSDVPGCRETVLDGVNGFLCAPRDSDDLARHLCRFIDNPDLIPQMGAASRRMAEERFDVKKCTERIIQAYGLEDK